MPLGPPLIYLLKNCCLSTGLFDESYSSMIVRSAPSVRRQAGDLGESEEKWKHWWKGII
jgi:hypothetical protein